jgi:hypothetical protein
MLATLILVIPSFVFFYGWGTIKEKEAQRQSVRSSFIPAGGGKKVDLDVEDLQTTRQRMIEQLSNLFGSPQAAQNIMSELSDEEVFPIEDVERRAIELWYLERVAEDEKIDVPVQEVVRNLNPMFAGMGKDEIAASLRSMGYSSEAHFIATQQAAERLQRATYSVTSQAKASLYDLWEAHRMQNEEMKLDYVAFKASDYRDKVPVDDAELMKYYTDNASAFEVGKQRVYRYAYLLKSALRDQVPAPAEEQLKSYFERNPENYRRGKQVKVRQIELPLVYEENMTPERRDEVTSNAFVLANDIVRQAREGVDFAELANLHSKDEANTSPTASGAPVKLGGLVPGWVDDDRRMELGWTFVDAALNLKAGEISEPVRNFKASGQVLSIIKLEEARESGLPDFAEVRARVEMDWRAAQLDSVFMRKFEELNVKTSEYSTLETMARDLKMNSGITTWTLTTSPMIGDAIIMEAQDLEMVNEELMKGNMSPLLRAQDTLYVLQVEDERPPHIPEFRLIRDQVETAYRAAKSIELAKTAARDFLTTATATDFLTTATAERLGAKTTELFTRMDPSTDFPAVLFNLDTDTYRVTTGTLGLSEGGSKDNVSAFVVWHVRELRTPDRESFRKDLPRLQRGVISAKQEGILGEWFWDKMKQTRILPKPEDQL